MKKEFKKTAIVYDKVVIGSSPIELIEVLRNSKIHENILVVEQNNAYGGAWLNIPIFHFDSAEAACHLLESYEGVYDFLEKNFGLEFEDMQPSPRIYYHRNFSVEYDAPFNAFYHLFFCILAICKQFFFSLFYFIRFKNDQKKKEVQKLKKNLFHFKHNFKLIERSINKNYPIQYFKGGSGNMIEHLLKKIKKKGIQLKRNFKIKEVTFKQNHYNILSSKEEIICAKTILLSQGMSIPNFVSSDTNIKFEIKKKEIHHCHVLVSGINQKLFSYLQFIFDKKIHRVTDITEFTKGIKHGHRLFLFELRSILKFNDANWLIQHLKEYKIIPVDVKVKIEEWKPTIFRYNTNALEAINKFEEESNKFFPHLKILKSKGDFTRSIKRTYLNN